MIDSTSPATQPAPDTASGSAPDTPSAKPDSEHSRVIRSFVRRAGRIGPGQERALAELGPQYLIPYQSNTLDLIALCADAMRANGPKASKIVLEIGTGMGEATAHIASLMQDALYIGCEVHAPGVGALLKRIGERGLTNLRIIQHDAVEVLTHMMPEASLDAVHIFFPDPWHKKRHHKRRLIQPHFVQLLCSRLKPSGILHCATDWQPYAEQILAVLSAEPQLKNTATSADGYAIKPDYRPLTKFENRGLKLGHGVWDLVFTRA
jgi:tRNA (guanine-N7-)-methyltransferase